MVSGACFILSEEKEGKRKRVSYFFAIDLAGGRFLSRAPPRSIARGATAASLWAGHGQHMLRVRVEAGRSSKRKSTESERTSSVIFELSLSLSEKRGAEKRECRFFFFVRRKEKKNSVEYLFRLARRLQLCIGSVSPLLGSPNTKTHKMQIFVRTGTSCDANQSRERAEAPAAGRGAVLMAADDFFFCSLDLSLSCSPFR